MEKKLEGKKCPMFKGDSTTNKTISNKDFLGKNLVIYLVFDKQKLEPTKNNQLKFLIINSLFELIAPTYSC